MAFLVHSLFSFGQTSTLQEGNECFDSGDYSCAIAKFNEVIESATGRDRQTAEINLTRANSCSEWLKLANQYFSQENFMLAKENYQNVIEENPNDSYAKVQLGICNTALITLDLSKTNLSFSASGGNVTITVTTQADTYVLSGLPAWCTYRKADKSFVISCNEHTGNSVRNGYVTVKAGNKTQKVNIRQDPKKPEIILTVSSQQLLFRQDGMRRTITDVETNASAYEIKGLPDWCKVGTKQATWFSLDCEANNTGKGRKGSFLVTAGDKELRIEISQPGRNRLEPQKSNSAVSSRNSTPSRVKKSRCFNCPKTKDSWGLTLGYSQMTFDPFEQLALSQSAYMDGIQLGLRFEPLFKYGFGLNTGIFLEAFSSDVASTLTSDFYFRRYSLNVPLHMEYRLNFSQWFNIFAYGGPAFNVVANSSFKEFLLPATLDYGAGLRINRIQINVGKSFYLGSFRNMANVRESIRNIGNDALYKDIILSISYMF